MIITTNTKSLDFQLRIDKVSKNNEFLTEVYMLDPNWKPIFVDSIDDVKIELDKLPDGNYEIVQVVKSKTIKNETN